MQSVYSGMQILWHSSSVSGPSPGISLPPCSCPSLAIFLFPLSCLLSLAAGAELIWLWCRGCLAGEWPQVLAGRDQGPATKDRAETQSSSHPDIQSSSQPVIQSLILRPALCFCVFQRWRSFDFEVAERTLARTFPPLFSIFRSLAARPSPRFALGNYFFVTLDEVQIH